MASEKVKALREFEAKVKQEQFDKYNTTVIVQEGKEAIIDKKTGQIIKEAIPEITKNVPLDSDGKPDSRYIGG